MRGFLLSALFFLFLPMAVQAEITFAQLTRLSPTPEVLQGRFTQEKYLGAVDAALTSTGVFTYQRGKSIRWDTLEPIQNRLLMTPSAITSQQGENELLRYDLGANPSVAVMARIFFSVLTAEWEKLSDHFALSGEIVGRQWHAVLVPLDQTVMQIFSRIELKGEDLLRVIVLYETNGDRTTIRLDKQGK